MSRNVISQSLSATGTQAEHRRHPRLPLQIPVFVRGKDSEGDSFIDLAKTLNISARGAYLTCPKPVRIGEHLVLTIPSPSVTVSGLLPPAMAPIQARVKRRQRVDDLEMIGVEFVKPLE